MEENNDFYRGAHPLDRGVVGMLQGKVDIQEEDAEIIPRDTIIHLQADFPGFRIPCKITITIYDLHLRVLRVHLRRRHLQRQDQFSLQSIK